ncbi:kinase-like protein [Cylindrobasidium torrendii FP15055 ss-10]|uniref:Kinase-like protein n=1 Tax=Cylindrobasidium torrendii FP15055 ss-10 TaxID=1314674 RepID=A0A0D7B343_9AGAR|nr:kinase-like protein [Cylindrobasidium torrendii FP15055 ss-10]
MDEHAYTLMDGDQETTDDFETWLSDLQSAPSGSPTKRKRPYAVAFTEGNSGEQEDDRRSPRFSVPHTVGLVTDSFEEMASGQQHVGENGPQIQTTEHKDFHMSPQDLIDAYQELLDHWPPENTEGRRECLHMVLRLAKMESVFPTSMYCPGLRVDDSQLCGEGGFAYVYKGVYDGNAVAVKALKQTIGRTERLWKTCAKEALLWRQLKHSNILTCYGVNEIWIRGHSSLCLIFPWVPNGDLRHYIQDKVPFGENDSFPLQALKDIVCGLEYLHGHDPPIVHADIRCANVLVMDDLSCCISDFGLSFPTEFTLTSHGGDVPGTIRFMAPEILSPPDGAQRATYDTPSRDVYSFGCLIAEVFTAEDPFSWLRNSSQVVLAIGRFKCPWNLPVFIPEPLSSLAMRCWNRDPGERPRMQDITVFFSLLEAEATDIAYGRLPVGYDNPEGLISAVDALGFAPVMVWSFVYSQSDHIDSNVEPTPHFLDTWHFEVTVRGFLELIEAARDRVLSSGYEPPFQRIGSETIDWLTYMAFTNFQRRGWLNLSDVDVLTIHGSVKPLFAKIQADQDDAGEVRSPPLNEIEGIALQPAVYPPEWPPFPAPTWAEAWEKTERSSHYENWHPITFF